MAMAASIERMGTRDALAINPDATSQPDARSMVSSNGWPSSVPPSTLIQEPFVDAERAAGFLSMRRKTLLDLARRGKLPGHPVGSGQRRMWKFRISELDHWMSAAVNLTQRPGPCSRRIS